MNQNIVTQEAVNSCLRYIDGSKKEQFLKIIEEIRIILDEPTYEDSIDGTSIRAMYVTTIIRKGKEPLKFQCIIETSIDFSKTPIDFGVGIGDKSDPVTESYNILEKDKPALHHILGLLKRNYFIPRDFSYKMAVEHINKLRAVFSKDEIVAFPSIDSSLVNVGLIPI